MELTGKPAQIHAQELSSAGWRPTAGSPLDPSLETVPIVEHALERIAGQAMPAA